MTAIQSQRALLSLPLNPAPRPGVSWNGVPLGVGGELEIRLPGRPIGPPSEHSLGAMYKVILMCLGVPETEGAAGAVAIEEEFARRPHHNNVTCRWEEGRLVLRGSNDFDTQGEAMADEFSDTICAFIPGTFGFEIRIVSVTEESA